MNSFPQTIIRCLFLTLLVVSSAPAFAQYNESSEEDLAVEHFDNGARLFYEGDFSGAIIEFRKAYEYNPDPMILYNISLAHERLFNIPEALRVAKTAAANPALPPQVALRNDARIAAFSIAVTTERIANRAADEARNAALAAQLKPGVSAPEATTPFWDSLTPVGWSGVATASAGIVLLTYAAAVNYTLSADIARYQTTPDPQEHNRLKDDITTRSKRGRITLYSGAALTAIGAGLLSFDLLYDRSNTETNSNLDDMLFGQKTTLKTLNLSFSPINTENLIQFSGSF